MRPVGVTTSEIDNSGGLPSPVSERSGQELVRGRRAVAVIRRGRDADSLLRLRRWRTRCRRRGRGNQSTRHTVNSSHPKIV